MFIFRDKVLCDIKLETDDGGIIFSLKWFWHWLVHIPMFTHFTVKNEDIIVMRQLDYITLQLLVDFIYSRNIIITENNVQVIIDKV